MASPTNDQTSDLPAGNVLQSFLYLRGKSSLKKNEIIRKVLLVNMEVNNGLMEMMLKLIWLKIKRASNQMGIETFEFQIFQPTFRIGKPRVRSLSSVPAVVIVARETSLTTPHHPHPVVLNVAGTVHRLEHDDHVGLGQGDVHSLPHLQLPRVCPVCQVVAVGDSGGAEKENIRTHQHHN